MEAPPGASISPLHTVRIEGPAPNPATNSRSAAANLQTYRRLGFSPTQIAFYMSYLRRSLMKYGKICLAPRHGNGRPVL